MKPPENVQEFIDTTNIGEPQLRNYFLKIYNEMQKTAPFLSFEMKFKNHEATFESQKQMSNDNNLDLNRTASLVGASGLFYTNSKKQVIIKQTDFSGKKIRIQRDFEDLDWILHNDTKIILGYQTRKATAEIDLNAFKKGTISAWYAPDLPFQFGPLDYAGLPGIILELKIKNFSFYADQIDFKKNEISITKPTKGVLIKEKEYLERTKKTAQQRYGEMP